MALMTDTWILDCLLLLTSALGLILWYFTKTANYFRDRGVPFLPQTPLVGCWQLLSLSQSDQSNYFYNAFPKERFFGFFLARDPCYVFRDPELINNVLVKDFAHFHDRAFATFESDPLTHNLFNLRGHKWRNLRYHLIPTFTSGKMKQMFDQLKKCGNNLLSEVKKAAEAREPVEARLFMNPFTQEVIGTTAFGLDLGRNNPQTAEFTCKINDAFVQTNFQLALNLLAMSFPKLVNFLGIGGTPKDVSEYFQNLTLSTKDYRRKNNVVRNDYFQLLLTLQEAEENGKNMTIANSVEKEDETDEIMKYVPKYSDVDSSKLFDNTCLTAQSFIFLVAGSETTASSLSFILHHLAKDPIIQLKAQEEVDSVYRKHKDWTYQAIKECTYIDQLIQEGQRMYPNVALLMRECTIPYHIPDSKVTIEKGTKVFIPTLGVQMDPKHYSNPEVFDPERFIDNNHRPSPTYMPFGDGPRICIGMRFALLEMKLCLAKLLLDYNILPSDKTEEPFIHDRKSFFPRPRSGIWVNFKPRNNATLPERSL